MGSSDGCNSRGERLRGEGEREGGVEIVGFGCGSSGVD